jgi:hypothetical protein
MYFTAGIYSAELGWMTNQGKIILNAIVLVAAAASITAAIVTTITALPPQGVYACDFRLISAATCDLPMAAHTTRVTPTLADADRAKRVVRLDRIIACEREKTAKRLGGEPVPAQKCWDERPTSLARVSSR